MPVLTTLEFFRTKQTVYSFEKNYPKSIYGLREAILGSLQSIDGALLDLTHEYLGGHPSHESYIREKMIIIHLLLTETNMDGIYKKSDFDTICDRAAIPSLNEHVNKLREVSMNVATFNPNSFTPIVELFEKIIACMEKYFLSFYDGSIHTCPSIYVKSAFTYETNKRDIIHSVKENLRAIYNLSNRFNTQNISVDNMGDNSKFLARKTKCNDMPFFLIFYESGELITESKRLLLQWIEADKDYCKTIKMDMANFAEEEKQLELKRRADYDEYIKTRHILDQLHRKHNELNVLKPIMKLKLKQSENKHYDTLIIIKVNELAMDKADHILKDLNTKLEKSDNPADIILAINEQKYIVEKNKKIMKENKLKLQRIENKIDWYKGFSEKYDDKTNKLDKINSQFTKIKSLVEEDEEQIKILRQYLCQLNKIYILKSSNVTLKKIFHNLDFGNRMSYLSQSSNSSENTVKDAMSEAINVTSKLIDKDWISLYVNLPFHPPRGSTEIENDVAKFTRAQVRGLNQDMALQSLRTWRRMHIRANVMSLISALEKINRFDIIKKFYVTPTESPQASVRRVHEDKLPPMSATTRFLNKHYPHLQSHDHLEAIS